ncbi:PH domain-containing protein [Microtetraspora malaysiensis]|uniref:PH domain-containing protein n=1 Tax=Microtetraspora malaysiensis TaxID=161358 RepID=A0ABW6SIF4_9ACTN
MTAAAPPPLPVTWRPRQARIIAYSMAAIMVVGSVVLAVILPEQFKLPDRLGMIAFGGAVAAVLHLLGRLRVEADERGIKVVNALRTHYFEWAQVLDVNLVEGDPWPKLDLADGNSVGAMGIQGSEKERSRKAVSELRALIRARGEAPDRD